jgi:hypothetical protein
VALTGEGRIGDAPMRRFTTLFLDHGERAEISPSETCEVLYYGLPDLRHLKALARPTAIAAE